MKDKLVVLCDVDGVLADMSTHFISAYKRIAGIQLTKDQLNDLPIIDNVVKLYSPVKKQASHLNKLYTFLGKKGTCYSLPIFPGAQETVKILLNDPMVDFRILTAQFSRSKTWVYERTCWLKDHFNITTSQVIFAKDKSLVQGHLFVDDTPKNITEWKAVNTNHVAKLWLQSHNVKYSDSMDILCNWDELLNLVESLKEKHF